MKKIKLGILYGGTSDEREVSLMTFSKVIESIDLNKYELISIEIPEDKSISWIENLINISCNRIREPYYLNNKIATI